MMGMMRKTWGLDYLMQTSGQAFVDWKKGKCTFNSDEFVALLELVKDLPDADAELDYEKFETYYRQNKSLLSYQYINSYDTLSGSGYNNRNRYSNRIKYKTRTRDKL